MNNKFVFLISPTKKWSLILFQTYELSKNETYLNSILNKWS